MNISIDKIKLDDQPINHHSFTPGDSIHCEKIEILFSNRTCLSFAFSDIPHFFGEIDLEVEKEVLSSIDEYKVINKEITFYSIIKWYWVPKGVNILPKKYLVLLEFRTNEYFLSLGAFYMKDKKLDFLSTGEIAFNITKHSIVKDSFENLICEEISYSDLLSL